MRGFYGLVRALRTAGAANVLVALWPLDDYQASGFKQAFYEHMLFKGLEPAAALRATQRD